MGRYPGLHHEGSMNLLHSCLGTLHRLSQAGAYAFTIVYIIDGQ
jgi:hypothetical protein